ncbi:MAG: hypothetical protein ACOY3L_11185 [Pseudomonadota bacterium]
MTSTRRSPEFSTIAARDWTETMRGLKTLVIVMGVLIVAGLVVVVATIASRLSSRMASAPTASTSATSTPAATAAEPGDVALPLPAGCRVAEMTAAGGRLWLRLAPVTGGETGAACADILILDPATAKVVGRLRA